MINTSSNPQLNDEEKTIIVNIEKSLQKLYSEQPSLFPRNNTKALCERCLVFRFALYLQENFSEYYVDCDFNSSSWKYYDQCGSLKEGENPAKLIRQSDGSFRKRFIDIIIHKRSSETDNNFLCFEVKKWNNSRGIKKDINNLKELTGDEAMFQYHYKLGLLIILGRTLDKTKIRLFKNGLELVSNL